MLFSDLNKNMFLYPIARKLKNPLMRCSTFHVAVQELQHSFSISVSEVECSLKGRSQLIFKSRWLSLIKQLETTQEQRLSGNPRNWKVNLTGGLLLLDVFTLIIRLGQVTSQLRPVFDGLFVVNTFVFNRSCKAIQVTQHWKNEKKIFFLHFFLCIWKNACFSSMKIL